MKFLHLSDLHIGKSVNGFSMLEEQKHVFRQILGYLHKERPAAVLIAGDVYDRAVPGVEAVRLFDDFLTDLSKENVSILLVSGNHDSPERLNYASRILSDRKIYLCGAFDGTLRGVRLGDEYGEVNFWLLPFIKPQTVRGLFEGRGIDSYNDAIAAALESEKINYSGRNVLVAHQFFTKAGVKPQRSESELNQVGGLDAVNVELIERFDYAALGHLHGTQTVGSEKIRYAGSPLKYSFSEWRQKKSVSLVELKEKGDLNVTKLPLTPFHDMREIKDKIEVLMSGAASSQTDKNDYLRVILTNEEEIIDPMGKIRSVYPNVMALEFDNSRTSVCSTEIAAAAEKIESLSPFELFSEFFLEMSGSVMSREQLVIVRELLESAEDEQ